MSHPFADPTLAEAQAALHDPRTPGLVETVTVTFDVFFTNVNAPMGLRAHSHKAFLEVTYQTLGRHGYPSFETTNRALEHRIRELTSRPFKDATNEDVIRRLFAHLDGWAAESWEPWGGDYRLLGLRLGVVGVHDDIGHDNATTFYQITRQARS